MKPQLRLQKLEDRLAPAIATWDGGGTNNLWTTAANWAGDVAPMPGDDLVFPSGAARLTNVNDFASNTSFGHISLDGFDYQITGNVITVTNGIGGTLPTTTTGAIPDFGLSVNLNEPQTFTGGTYSLSGEINLNFFGQLLTTSTTARSLTISGSIVGPGSIVNDGNSTLFLTGNNTSTGAVLAQGGIVYINGSQSGSVAALGGVVSGVGSTFSLSAASGGTITPGDGLPNISPTGHRLTTSNLNLGAASPGVVGAAGILDVLVRRFTSDDPVDHDQFVVNGFVQLGGKLKISTISFSHGGPLDDGTIKIIDNDGTDAVAGIFAGLPEGAVINGVNEKAVRISYKGGDGNDVTLTTVNPAVVPRFAVGAGAGGGPQVNVYAVGNAPDGSSATGAAVFLRAFNAYDPAFTGGVHVATGDITGDGVIDIVTGPGAGGGPHVRVFNGATGALVSEFNAYDVSFRGGVNVALGDFDVDGTLDIVTGAGPGGGPHVKVFSGRNGALFASFLAYAPSFTGGVNVAAGDLFGAGRAVIVTGAGVGGGPHVNVFEVSLNVIQLRGFFAYDSNLRGGVTVAVGDTNNDGTADIITGAGPGTSPNVRAFEGQTNALLLAYPAYNPLFTGGITVAAFSLYGFGASIVTGAGPGGGPHVRSVDPNGVNFLAFDPSFTGGVFVG